ncbi:uncharacterized protein BT62DRAFT_1007547 [Guyanagaster necrorhizus]|uniref:NAD(P)-binding domain-containing protein n=1 Tax=Guyanagaster necrorhizus TaxID=856835 RepID=A0A9P8ARQ8_9AGAR|nr:uncharacterized protein BT62DRAFT_1007547 [Guyanagaster necrorhizus MCA 3950]KAG7445161.1 hypothetical protein BT62DRAFT_1007547 [Guyanagaster necrorhizus MCA 3950]
MSGKTALIIGATGQTGQHVLKELLGSSHYTKVGEYGRRLTDLSTLSAGKDKLVQKSIDFEKLEESGIKDGKWDVVFITLGTTRKAAGSAAAFERIDRDYVINSAKEARVPDHPQRVVYLSAAAANAKSSFLYPRCKGQTEEALASMGYSDTIVFHPGLLTGTARPQSRIQETIAEGIFNTFRLPSFFPNLEIKVATLGKSMAIAGWLGSERLPSVAQAAEEETPEGKRFVSIPNAGAAALAQTSWE